MSIPESRWLIVGLGNPGARYETTWHNIGFLTIDRLAEKLNTSVKREECRAFIGQASFESTTVELVKPQTFMNLSGEAVSCLVKKASRENVQILVISDDLALPCGKLRLRPKGSDGGHNGLKSIAACLKTSEYARLRIGILPEHPVANTRDYVLDRIPKNVQLSEILDEAATAVLDVVSYGIDKAMAKWN